MADEFTKYTETVIAAIGPKASPRVKHVMPILIKHLHAAIVEADITMEEWLAACDLIVEAGQVSSDKRNEVILCQDVLGVESLVDMLDHKRAAEAANADPSKVTDEASSTYSAILGPFYRAGVPVQPNGTSIIRQDEPNADYTYLSGVVRDAKGKPIKGATVDIWHDAPDGLYDSQDESKPEFHCRGRFETDSEGRYSAIALKPTPYPIPFDHSAGKLLTLMDRHPYRPAHIHFNVMAPGHKSLVTQVFDKTSDYLTDDSVFAVKSDLIVDFRPISEEPTGWKAPAEYKDKMTHYLQYDIGLVEDVQPKTNGVNGH